MLIGVTGRTGRGDIAGCGKDTVAEMIRSEIGGVIYGFADPLYNMIQAGFGIDGKSAEWQDRAKKSAAIDWLSSNNKNISLRFLLETLGTEWGRHFVAEDIWTRLAKRALDHFSEGLIIRDLRFENEVEWIKREGGLIVYVIRPDYDDRSATENHQSNTPLSDSCADFIIINNSTLDDLKQKILKITANLKSS